MKSVKEVERKTSQPSLLPPLRSVYDFKDVKGIGAGAFANVFSALELVSTNPNRYRKVALKRINLSAMESDYYSTNTALCNAVINEVNIFKALAHRYIVKCYYSFDEVSPHSGVKYMVLVLEYVNGGDLENWLKAKTNGHRALVPEADIWRVFHQIADAVSYIHTKHILHRDLKPPNVLMTDKGNVKLTDFGLSRQQSGASGAVTVCGTPYYMAPERILEHPYTEKSDIWSLGCILYEMATLRSPFAGETANITSLVQKIGDAEYPPLPDSRYSDQLEMLIQLCLCPKCDARPSADDIKRFAGVMSARWGNK